MLKFLVIIMLTFTLIEAAHLNYHVQSEVKAEQSEANGRSTGVQP